MEVESEGQVRRIGLGSGNIVGPDSDWQLGLQLLLARMDYLLSTNSKHRELFTEIQDDWELLQRAERLMPAHTQVVAGRQ